MAFWPSFKWQGPEEGVQTRARVSSCVFVHHLLIHYQMSRVPSMTPSSHAFYPQSDSVLSYCFMTCGSFRIQLQNKQENDNSSISCWLFFFFPQLARQVVEIACFPPLKNHNPRTVWREGFYFNHE